MMKDPRVDGGARCDQVVDQVQDLQSVNRRGVGLQDGRARIGIGTDAAMTRKKKSWGLRDEGSVEAAHSGGRVDGALLRAS